jgi:hypothetical protein
MPDLYGEGDVGGIFPCGPPSRGLSNKGESREFALPGKSSGEALSVGCGSQGICREGAEEGMQSGKGMVGKRPHWVALAFLVGLTGLPAASFAQSRLPASDEPGRIERRFPAPADMLRGETPTNMSSPPGSGNHPAPGIRKEDAPVIIQDGEDIILQPSKKEGEKK